MDAGIGTLTGVLGFAYFGLSMLEPRLWIPMSALLLSVTVAALATKPVDYFLGYTFFFVDWLAIVVVSFCYKSLEQEQKTREHEGLIAADANARGKPVVERRKTVQMYQEIAQCAVYMSLVATIVVSFFLFQDSPSSSARTAAFAAAIVVGACSQMWSNLNIRAELVIVDKGVLVRLPLLYPLVYSLHSVNVGLFFYGATVSCVLYETLVVAFPFLLALAAAALEKHEGLHRWWHARAVFETMWFAWYGIFEGFPHGVGQPQPQVVLAFASLACIGGGVFAVYTLQRVWQARTRLMV